MKLKGATSGALPWPGSVHLSTIQSSTFCKQWANRPVPAPALKHQGSTDFKCYLQSVAVKELINDFRLDDNLGDSWKCTTGNVTILHPPEPFIKSSPEFQPQGGQWQKANPGTTLPPWHRHNQGQGVPTPEGGGEEEHVPKFQTRGLRRSANRAADQWQPRLPTPSVLFTADHQGFCLHRLTRASHLVPEHSPVSGLRLLASFPSLLLRSEGLRVANDPRPGAQRRHRLRRLGPVLSGLRLPRATQGRRPPRPNGGDWPGTAIGRGPHRSPREPGRWGGEEVAAAALHQPCSAGGRMSPGARSGSEGTGRALGSPPRPGDPPMVR